MKKVALVTLLAMAGAAPLARTSVAAVPGPQQAAGQTQGGQNEVVMQPEEAAAYQAAVGQSSPAAQAQALQDYLTKYPNSGVKKNVLQQIMFAWSQANDAAKTQAAADAVLASDPNNLPALIFETQLRMQSDPATASTYAQKAIALGQPAGMDAAQFAQIKANGYPVLYSAEGAAALKAKDSATAVTAYKNELSSVPVEQTTKPGIELQDTYSLAQAYLAANPPDYLNCAYYAARGMYYAPDPYKTTFKQLATYCYHRYHGKDEGFDAVVAVAKDNLTPPSTFSVTPAPKPEDLVEQTIASTPNLAELAIGDKEFILQYGKPADAEKVFDTIKGKTAEFPGVVVISATETSLQVAVSDDAQQSKTADFTFNMKEPLKTVPATGSKVTITGTYASYTQKPVMITMQDAALVVKAAPKAPVHHTTTTHRR